MLELQSQLTESGTGGSSAGEPQWADSPQSARRETGTVLPFPPRPDRAPVRASRAAAVLPQDYEPVGVSPFRVTVRLFELVGAIFYFWTGAFFDWWTVARRPGREAVLLGRRAARLRRIFQRLGGTFIKVGQQMSIRTDVFHPVYCHELEKLLDNAELIPEAYVREVIERRTGKPLEATFAEFDFSAFGRASIACVYKACLHSGEVVAVKIRRPGIKRHFKTDLTALGWVLRTAEFLTILRPRVSSTFRVELELMLFEELDFRLEVRYQELFRRYFKKRKKLNTTAPRPYYHLCGPGIIVSEFVTGVWMKELMAGVESGDPCYLEELRAQDIDPERVAKQLVRGSHYGFFECPFFHGDPHPGNILIQPGNRIVMVDFGACGVFAERDRIQLAQMHYYHSQEDVGGMVQCVIHLMEPLPPIDLDSLRRRLENEWWKGFYGIKSHHADWRERTSFRLWTALFREVRRFQIPIPLNVLRMIRATLLYDSVAARIYPQINVFKEYRKYYDGYARRIQKEIQRSLLRQLLWGPDPINYVRLKRLWDVGDLLLRQAQALLRRPIPDFSALVSKGYDILMMAFKWSFLSSGITAAALIAGFWLTAVEARTLWLYPIEFLKVVKRNMKNPNPQAAEVVFIVWLVLILLVTAKYLHQMWFRLCDKDDLLSGRDSGRRR